MAGVPEPTSAWPRVPFADRRHGGRLLARRLSSRWAAGRVVVFGLPRGGVPVAYEVALALGAQLDVLAVRKLGVPGSRELAMGAIASGGVCVLNDDVIAASGVGAEDIVDVARREAAELERRERLYRGGRQPVAVAGVDALVVDDGLATGATMRAAVRALRQRGARSIVAAAPVGATETCAALAAVVDDVVCVHAPDPFVAVGAWYVDFAPTRDDDVRALLESSRARTPVSGDQPSAEIDE